jgi:hypothetical protein
MRKRYCGPVDEPPCAAPQLIGLVWFVGTSELFNFYNFPRECFEELFTNAADANGAVVWDMLAKSAGNLNVNDVFSDFLSLN